MARATGGFQGLGRPKELQQLVSRTCGRLLELTAVGSHSGYNATDGVVHHRLQAAVKVPMPQLLKMLHPQLQLRLFAEVAVGICCSRWVGLC